MNIVTPIPTTLVFNNANVNTESARRDNQLRETIPQAASNENSEAKSGLGSESDRVKKPGIPNSPLVYERPQPNVSSQAQGKVASDNLPDNAEDQSAGKEGAEDQQQQQAQQREVRELSKRDREVRAHEQAHASVGGQYAAAPTYQYETGPDGRRYAVGGEVSIDISDEPTPEQTLRKMQQVKAAALAPAEPSPQDLRVASEATQKAFDAQTEINEQRSEELTKARSNQNVTDTSTIQPEVPTLDEIVDGIDVSPPERSLDKDVAAQSNRTLAEDREANRQSDRVLKAVEIIRSRYDNIAASYAPNVSLTA